MDVDRKDRTFNIVKPKEFITFIEFTRKYLKENLVFF